MFASALSLFLEAFEASDFVGKFIFFLLFLLSLSSWALILYKFSQLKSLERQIHLSLATVREYKGTLLDPLASLQPGICTFLYQDLRKLLLRKREQGHSNSVSLSPSEKSSAEDRADSHIRYRVKEWESYFFLLSTAVSLAPFLGILGTVWGLLVSLHGLQQGSNSLANQSVLSGLSTALATTVLGLFIAIPALIAHNFLKAKLKEVALEASHFYFECLEKIPTDES